jgi:hypothetical protein
MALGINQAKQPIHPDHAQPSDIGEVLPFATRDRRTWSRPDITVAGIVDRYEVPADGIIEVPYFTCAVCGTGAGPNTMDLKKNGTTMLSAVMSIAHDDPDGTRVVGAFAAPEDAEVVRGDVITLEASAGATAQSGASAGYTFRHLGRAS